MKAKDLLLIALVALFPLTAAAEEGRERVSGTFSFYFENDIFAGTDRDYTSGWKLAWISPNLTGSRENSSRPKWGYSLIKWLPFVREPGCRNSISLALGQNFYTPKDIEQSELIVDDRPYAGLLYLEFGVQSRTARRLSTLEFDLGIVGPHSFAEQTQKLIHQLFGFIEPRGWDNQLKDELALQIIYEQRWKAVERRTGKSFGFDLIPHLGGGLGNICTYANTGMQFRLGWNLPRDFGISLLRPGGESNTAFCQDDSSLSSGRRFGLHFFLSIDGHAVVRNVFLDGNTFSDSHRVDKRLFTADVLAGVRINSKRLSFSYAYVFRTKQFEMQRDGHVFGALSLSFSY